MNPNYSGARYFMPCSSELNNVPFIDVSPARHIWNIPPLNCGGISQPSIPRMSRAFMTCMEWTPWHHANHRSVKTLIKILDALDMSNHQYLAWWAQFWPKWLILWRSSEDPSWLCKTIHLEYSFWLWPRPQWSRPHRTAWGSCFTPLTMVLWTLLISALNCKQTQYPQSH